MQLINAGPDQASRTALRLLMQGLPGISEIKTAVEIDPPGTLDQPQLRSAQIVEGSVMRARKIPGISRDMKSGFGAFLDGAQKVRLVAQHRGVPLIFGVTSAVVRVRINRRLTTWGHQKPKVEYKLYLPLRYLPPIGELAIGETKWPVVDTTRADANGDYPSAHPQVLLDRAIRAIDQQRELLEDQIAESWCSRNEAPLFVDGGISRSAVVASSRCAVGVIKSHRTLYVEDDALRIVLNLGVNERSSVFKVSPRARNSVMSWYLRQRDADGHDPLWGLVRVEMSECDNPAERADEISRWVLAETTPLALPDGRWDKMSYGVRDCEEFLRAIS
ncbi:MAG TPA: hypothetical protein VJ852_13595 [Gemmatimonadaceae bacterium]|nr:hypothetical protein [Gemmatimonadaceae bacterium]